MSVFKFQKRKNQRDNSFSNLFDWIRNLHQPNQFSSSKNVKRRETILLAISLIGIEAYISQNQFSSFKSVKRRGTILLAISLIGIKAYISQSQFSELPTAIVSFQVPKA